MCSICGSHMETVQHLFFTCPKIDSVWKHCSKWFNTLTVFPENVDMNFQHLPGEFRLKHHIQCWKVIWSAIVWCLWRTRNHCV